MKKFILEYVNIIGYVITGLIFSLAVFILFINFYHYKEVAITYNKGDSYMNTYNKSKETIQSIKNDLSVYDPNAYHGGADNTTLMQIHGRLNLCVSAFENSKVNDILQKQVVGIKDVYSFSTLYQSEILNDCVVMQIYSINGSNIPSYNAIKPYIDLDVKSLLSDLNYTKKNLQNNSSYQFTSDFDRVNVFDITRDSYTNIEASYNRSLELVKLLSQWFKNTVQGGV